MKRLFIGAVLMVLTGSAFAGDYVYNCTSAEMPNRANIEIINNDADQIIIDGTIYDHAGTSVDNSSVFNAGNSGAVYFKWISNEYSVVTRVQNNNPVYTDFLCKNPAGN